MTMVVRAERTPGAGWVARGISAGASVPEPELDDAARPARRQLGPLRLLRRRPRLRARRPRSSACASASATGSSSRTTPSSGWALFFTDRPVERPAAIVELLDATGTAVASHQWPAGPELPDALRRRIPLVLTRRA